jgi:hypothetical protein
MKTLNNTFFKAIRIFVIIFALTFSGNINATTSVNTSLVTTSVNVMSTNLYATSTAQYALTWGWLRDLIKAIKGGQSSGGSQGGGDSVPLDGGLGILLVGAAAFGIKKLRDKKNDKI